VIAEDRRVSRREVRVVAVAPTPNQNDARAGPTPRNCLFGRPQIDAVTRSILDLPARPETRVRGHAKQLRGVNRSYIPRKLNRSYEDSTPSLHAPSLPPLRRSANSRAFRGTFPNAGARHHSGLRRPPDQGCREQQRNVEHRREPQKPSARRRSPADRNAQEADRCEESAEAPARQPRQNPHCTD